MRELELKVKQLESVIQKRFPNSISALILATSSSSSSKNPDEKEEEEEAGSVKDLAHLRRRVRELEVEQGERGKEEQRRMQALQQQYSAMEVCVSLDLHLDVRTPYLQLSVKGYVFSNAVMLQLPHVLCACM